ncbi:hypothetical protein SteCoe_18240 [Stentor coeruleus]|uniref:Uncharacterized protein n=1 Tax=Stentor coeruleus TaxID=5963 RepID=A0A1R2BXI7_9CILI|nr:hypothetical protein SteCoe_18240 [Stentor coeruleus]
MGDPNQGRNQYPPPSYQGYENPSQYSNYYQGISQQNPPNITTSSNYRNPNPPPISGYNQPPSISNYNQPPPISGYNQPPSISNYNPPPSINTYNPPPSMNNYNPPPQISTYNPPPPINTYNPPPPINTYNPPPQINTYNSPPPINTYNPPPQIGSANNIGFQYPKPPPIYTNPSNQISNPPPIMTNSSISKFGTIQPISSTTLSPPPQINTSNIAPPPIINTSTPQFSTIQPISSTTFPPPQINTSNIVPPQINTSNIVHPQINTSNISSPPIIASQNMPFQPPPNINFGSSQFAPPPPIITGNSSFISSPPPISNISPIIPPPPTIILQEKMNLSTEKCVFCSEQGVNLILPDCLHLCHLPCYIKYKVCAKCNDGVEKKIEIPYVVDMQKCAFCRDNTNLLMCKECNKQYCFICVSSKKLEKCCESITTNLDDYKTQCQGCLCIMSYKNFISLKCKDHDVLCKKCWNISFTKEKCVMGCKLPISMGYYCLCEGCDKMQIKYFGDFVCPDNCMVCDSCQTMQFLRCCKDKKDPICAICNNNLLDIAN